MDDISNLWLDSDVVWAAAHGPLTEERHRELAKGALALAVATGHSRLLFDIRRAAVSHDVLQLNRHAEWLSDAELAANCRVALLCRRHTPDCQFWAQVLRLRGIIAAVFTDADHAVQWLHSDLETK